MKRMLIVAAMLCCAIPAFSQTPKAEIFGGYSFARMGSENFNKGWVGSVTGNFNRWFAIEGDVHGQYLSQDVSDVSTGTVVTGTATIGILSYYVGPRLAFRVEGMPVTPFVHALVGGAHTTLGGTANVSGVNVTASTSSNGIAVLTGGGVDIGYGSVVVRTQVDYSRLDVNNLFGVNGTSNGARVSAGVVFRIR
jgi:hypothetical protein